MDSRRFLIPALAAIPATNLGGCGALRALADPPLEAAVAEVASPPPGIAVLPTVEPPPRAFAVMAPIPNPPQSARERRPLAAAVEGRSGGVAAPVAVSAPTAPASARARPERRAPDTGPTAIAAANADARTPSRAEGFVGGLQIFAYDPGRLYEIWTAPLRVTTLTLGPRETIVSMAAGDTVRWQIGETVSGEGSAQRAHVMIKPLERGLETNVVLTTRQRVYLIELKSGPPETFNAAVAWDAAAALPPAAPVGLAAEAETAQGGEPLALPAGPLDARFRIVPLGRRPAWTPTAVMTDGVRTFLVFPPGLAAREAPALFLVGPDGGAQLVNYRQQDGLWVVDRVFERAELRVGAGRREVVRLVRGGDGT